MGITNSYGKRAAKSGTILGKVKEVQYNFKKKVIVITKEQS